MQKSIFITGSGAGIGRAAAKFFSDKGWIVCATDIHSGGLESLKEDIGEKHSFMLLDVKNADDVKSALLLFSNKTGGTIDVLLNNAGIGIIDNFKDTPLDKLTNMHHVNTDGVMNCCYFAAPYLEASPQGKIINMCSAASNYGLPSEAVYSATKFWVRGFTEALNIEWESLGIHVCDILPSFVDTPMMEECSGDIVDSVGINLTTDDVVNVIWKSTNDRSVIHWHVDTTKMNIVRSLSHFIPRKIMRSVVKKLSGY
ncbi:SDR family oxidoreductase [Alcanivorax sp.]|jgi:short-subunit dehydrogenase|uniref:SDR family oxidoreductase n=1 Tax=Alcanivorax sp. TaxID=1872427 RepID=UPI0032D8B8BA